MTFKTKNRFGWQKEIPATTMAYNKTQATNNSRN